MNAAAHLYVHVPFCARRCSYCSFAIAVRSKVPASRFCELLERELDIRFARRWDTPLQTLYLGGGTPSHIGGDGVRDLLDRIRAHIPLASTCEITLEANPEDVSSHSVAQWLKAGVNRISLGVQSFSDPALKWMHRVHDAATARQALALVTSHFQNVSADLIFALPENIPRDPGADVSELVDANVRHASVYGLTVEPKTPFARWIDRGESREATEDRYEAEYMALDETLGRAGFVHYEVSSFAQPGHRSRHNSSYWDGSAYAGVGPAAHGFNGTVRRWNVPQFEEWRKLVEAGADPLADSENLSTADRVAEAVYLGLRTSEGLSLIDDEPARVQPWVSSGWGVVEGARLRLSALGWLRLDSLAAALTLWRSR